MPPWAVILASTSAVTVVIRHGMTLWFLCHVFDRSGDRKDLEIAGKAISPRLNAISEARRRQPSSGQRHADVRHLPPPKFKIAEDESVESVWTANSEPARRTEW
jgi:hypothetical protein